MRSLLERLEMKAGGRYYPTVHIFEQVVLSCVRGDLEENLLEGGLEPLNSKAEGGRSPHPLVKGGSQALSHLP